jgi:hypothetical protein
MSNTGINETCNYDVELDSDSEYPYKPAMELPYRPYFKHVKLPPKIMRLQKGDDYNFTMGEAYIPPSEDPEDKSISLLASSSIVLGPGEELSIPCRLLNRSEEKIDPKANVMLHKDRFISQIDEDISILNTLENVERCGFTVVNRTNKIVTIPESAKLAYIERVQTKTLFGVKNINNLI